MSIGEWIYDTVMFPLEKRMLHRARKDLLSGLSGRVLEVGAGTGRNFDYYPWGRVESLTVLDREIKGKVRQYSFPRELPVDFVDGNVEMLEFSDQSFDCVVFTLVFCSVEQPLKGLAEIYRVLKPGGTIFFLEHVRPGGKMPGKLLDRAAPAWRRVSGGCHLNRDTVEAIVEAGFRLEEKTLWHNGVFRGGRGRKAD